MENQNIKELLEEAKTIAVFGLSSNTSKPSYKVSSYMQSKGYKIYPINPNEKEVLGEKSYSNLKELPEKPDIVDVFRRSETVLEIVDECIELDIKSIWFQLGVINEEAIEKAKKNGINVIVNKCIFVEHSKYF
ncbi:MAG: CoA-binding protein [Cyanobacteriota bacterium]